jgi:hypothetical protein
LALRAAIGRRQAGGMPVLVTLLASIALTTAIVAFMTIANWPRGETPRRPLGKTTELTPLERL